MKERDDPRVARTKAEEEAAGAGRGEEEREKLAIFSARQKIMSLRMPGLFQ
jgi:hypothetical protein